MKSFGWKNCLWNSFCSQTLKNPVQELSLPTQFLKTQLYFKIRPEFQKVVFMKVVDLEKS